MEERGKRVVVVRGEGAFADRLRGGLGGSGLEVTTASAVELDEILRGGVPDAIVVDRTGRPESGAEDLERRLPADARLSGIWIVTASTSEGEEGRAAGSASLRHVVVAPRRDLVPAAG